MQNLSKATEELLRAEDFVLTCEVPGLPVLSRNYARSTFASILHKHGFTPTTYRSALVNRLGARWVNNVMSGILSTMEV